LQRSQVLHIGDSFEADFCGARAAGFQALYLDRSGDPRVTTYSDYSAVDYPGKCHTYTHTHTLTYTHTHNTYTH
jgi:FMN phosphatase YigB (HAD superfamily)